MNSNHQKNYQIYIIQAVLSALLFALATPLSKSFLDNIDPILLAALFYGSAAIFLLLFSINEIPEVLKALKNNQKDLARMFTSAIFGGTVGPICILYGLTKINASTTSLLLSFESVSTALIAYFVMKEHLGKKTIIAIVLTLLSNFLLFFEDFTFNPFAIFIIVGAFAWGIDNTVTAAIETISPKMVTLFKSSVAGVVNLTIYFLIFNQNEHSITASMLILPFVIGVLSYGASIILYISSAKNIGATRSQIIFAFSPYAAVLISFLALKENPSTLFWPALLLAISSNILIFIENHTHKHIHHEEEHTHEHNHEDGHHSHTHDQSIQPTNKTHTHHHRHQHLIHGHHHLPDIHHHHKH